jgi:putative holliday junction resolvase
MKILGIDFGSKRIGLAISDESLTLARELAILSPKEFWEQIDGIVSQESIERVVIGLPLNMAGGQTDSTRLVSEFADQLAEHTGVPQEFMDERLSSSMAESIAPSHGKSGKGKRKSLDSLAAQIILQNYLDKHSKEGKEDK